MARHRQIVARELATGQNALVSRAPAARRPTRTPGSRASAPMVRWSRSTSVATNLLPGVGGPSRRARLRAHDGDRAARRPARLRQARRPSRRTRAVSPSLSDDGAAWRSRPAGTTRSRARRATSHTQYVYVIAGRCPAPAGARRAATARRGRGQADDHRRVAAAQALPRRQARDREARPPLAGRSAGTAFRFGLSTDADVSIAIQRRPPAGVRRRALPQADAEAAQAAGVRSVRQARRSSMRRGLAAGAHSGRVQRPVGRKALAAGRYRGELGARNAAGARSRSGSRSGRPGQPLEVAGARAGPVRSQCRSGPSEPACPFRTGDPDSGGRSSAAPARSAAARGPAPRAARPPSPAARAAPPSPRPPRAAAARPLRSARGGRSQPASSAAGFGGSGRARRGPARRPRSARRRRAARRRSPIGCRRSRPGRRRRACRTAARRAGAAPSRPRHDHGAVAAGQVERLRCERAQIR